ncbi:MAG TPA: class I SAM-dependent methyltransferase, partial [Candidatus Limnocylindria bacterium]|nr:class I SAM-dependent methyltransferase [Candidatus Limnocylindria bacterium]
MSLPPAAPGDPFGGQASDAGALAEIYDLEHDAVTTDLGFYRQMTRRVRGAVLDLGCGSGRLFGAFLDGRASRVVGVDASAAMLRRAEVRIAGDPRLAAALASGALELIHGDVRSVRHRDRFGLIVAAGVVPHLDGPEDLSRLLARAAKLLAPRGFLVLDDLGPGQHPVADLPLAVDWVIQSGGRTFTRRSQLSHREAPEGLRVTLSTIVDVQDPDGTIARLPASFRLWYPSGDAVARLVEAAGLAVAATYGSHDLGAFSAASEHLIVLCRRIRHRSSRR